MEVVSLCLSNREVSSDLYFGSGALLRVKDVIGDARNALVVLDAGLPVDHPVYRIVQSLSVRTMVAPARGEALKTSRGLEEILASMHHAGLDRQSLLVAVGGGALLDVAGLAASLYMRGVRLVSIPTTLLSQVDSSFGGKTAINLCGMKNLVGTFWPAESVIVDPTVLTTLPEREVNAGIAEIIKHGCIADSGLIELLREWRGDIGDASFDEILRRAIVAKAKVVQEDPRESGFRKILNFGHTIGHALEAISLGNGGDLLHGEAVALGMIVESHVSERVLALPSDVRADLEGLIRRLVPVSWSEHVSSANVLSLVQHDKKKRGGRVGWSLIRDVGVPCWDVEVPDEIVEESLRSLS